MNTEPLLSIALLLLNRVPTITSIFISLVDTYTNLDSNQQITTQKKVIQSTSQFFCTSNNPIQQWPRGCHLRALNCIPTSPIHQDDLLLEIMEVC